MDLSESDLETKCENLMNIVVESRKIFGKMCVDYEKKSSMMENKMLNLQIAACSIYKSKPKHPIPAIENKDFKDMEDFTLELLQKSKKIENLEKKLKNTQEVVAQLNVTTDLGRRLRELPTDDFLLAKVKGKMVT